MALKQLRFLFRWAEVWWSEILSKVFTQLLKFQLINDRCACFAGMAGRIRLFYIAWAWANLWYGTLEATNMQTLALVLSSTSLALHRIPLVYGRHVTSGKTVRPFGLYADYACVYTHSAVLFLARNCAGALLQSFLPCHLLFGLRAEFVRAPWSGWSLSIIWCYRQLLLQVQLPLALPSILQE